MGGRKVAIAALTLVSLFLPGCGYQGIMDMVKSVASIDAPVFSKAEGVYNNDISITMSCATEGALIHYTVDGSSPTEAYGTPYQGAPIPITATTTIKAVAYRAGSNASAVTTAVYTLRAATPTFGPDGGIYGSTQNVSVTTITTIGDDPLHDQRYGSYARQHALFRPGCSERHHNDQGEGVPDGLRALRHRHCGVHPRHRFTSLLHTCERRLPQRPERDHRQRDAGGGDLVHHQRCGSREGRQPAVHGACHGHTEQFDAEGHRNVSPASRIHRWRQPVTPSPRQHPPSRRQRAPMSGRRVSRSPRRHPAPPFTTPPTVRPRMRETPPTRARSPSTPRRPSRQSRPRSATPSSGSLGCGVYHPVQPHHHGDRGRYLHPDVPAGRGPRRGHEHQRHAEHGVLLRELDRDQRKRRHLRKRECGQHHRHPDRGGRNDPGELRSVACASVCFRLGKRQQQWVHYIDAKGDCRSRNFHRGSEWHRCRLGLYPEATRSLPGSR